MSCYSCGSLVGNTPNGITVEVYYATVIDYNQDPKFDSCTQRLCFCIPCYTFGIERGYLAKEYKDGVDLYYISTHATQFKPDSSFLTLTTDEVLSPEYPPAQTQERAAPRSPEMAPTQIVNEDYDSEDDFEEIDEIPCSFNMVEDERDESLFVFKYPTPDGNIQISNHQINSKFSPLWTQPKKHYPLTLRRTRRNKWTKKRTE